MSATEPTIEEVWRMARRNHFPHRSMDEHMAAFDQAIAGIARAAKVEAFDAVIYRLRVEGMDIAADIVERTYTDRIENGEGV